MKNLRKSSYSIRTSEMIRRYKQPGETRLVNQKTVTSSLATQKLQEKTRIRQISEKNAHLSFALSIYFFWGSAGREFMNPTMRVRTAAVFPGAKIRPAITWLLGEPGLSKLASSFGCAVNALKRRTISSGSTVLSLGQNAMKVGTSIKWSGIRWTSRTSENMLQRDLMG